MTFGPDIEYWLLRHFFKGESFPVLPQCWLVLLESYPGNAIPSEDLYEPFDVYPEDWSVIYDATYGKLLTNNIEFWFYAENDFPTDVGGWLLLFSPPLPSGEVMYFAEAVVTPKPVYSGDYVVFSAGDLTIGQNGGLYPGHFTDYAEEKLLKQAFELEDFSPPSLWVGLLSDDPTDAGTNESCNEIPLSGGYARVATSFADWRSYLWGTMFNDNLIKFPRAESNWGTVKYFGLFDTSSPNESGNLLIYGALVATYPPESYPVVAEPHIIGHGDTPAFAANELAVRFSV